MLVKLIQHIIILISLCGLTGYSMAAEISEPFPQLDANRTIRIALPNQLTNNQAAPENAQFLVNFLKEYWQIWSIDNELSVEFFYMSTAQAIDKLKQNDIDIISVNIFREDSPNILHSIPFAKYKPSIFRNINSDATSGIHIAIHSPAKTTLNFLPSNIERTYFPDETELLRSSIQYDAIYSTNPHAMKTALNNLGLSQLFYVNNEEVPEVNLHFSTRKDDRALLHLINQGLRQIKPVQAKLWSDKYLTTDEHNFVLTLGHYLDNLTPEQQQYIIDNNVIRYPITSDGFPPVIITNNFANIINRGFAADLIRIATEKTGIIFKPLYVDDFEQVISEVNNGAAELLVNVEYSKWREKDYSFSKPYLKAHYSVAYNPDTITIDQFSAIGKHTIAVVKDFNSTTLLQQRFSNALYKTFSTIEEAIRAVADGDAQVFVGRSLTTSYLIKENRLSNLTSQPIPSFHSEAQFTFATTKQHQLLIPLLNRTLNAISADKYDALYAKWSQSAFPQANIQAQVAVAYRQASYVFSAIMLVALIIFWIYYRQLRAR